MYLDQIAKIKETADEIRKTTDELREENAKREAQIRRNQDIIAIRNLMGRFSIFYSAGQYMDLPEMFTDTEAAYLQRSDVGIYQGIDSVRSYFAQLQEDILPGTFRRMLINSQVIEIAGDGKTAQGVWFLTGMEAIKDPENPDAPAVDMWINDKLAVEFLQEGNRWVILRMMINEEARALYHMSWGEYACNPAYPDFDRFAEPDREADRQNPFREGRPSMKNLTTPEPYESYSDLTDHF